MPLPLPGVAPEGTLSELKGHPQERGAAGLDQSDASGDDPVVQDGLPGATVASQVFLHCAHTAIGVGDLTGAVLQRGPGEPAVERIPSRAGIT